MSNGQYGYGSPYHGPSNSPGLTKREYDEMQAEYYADLAYDQSRADADYDDEPDTDEDEDE